MFILRKVLKRFGCYLFGCCLDACPECPFCQSELYGPYFLEKGRLDSFISFLYSTRNRLLPRYCDVCNKLMYNNKFPVHDKCAKNWIPF